MDGIQKTVLETLRLVTAKVEGGYYGDGDDFNVELFRQEFEDIVMLDIE